MKVVGLVLKKHDRKEKKMAGRLPIGSGCFLVSYDFTNGKDKSIMLVGQRDIKGNTVVINGFQGEEDEVLFAKLTTTDKVWS